MATPISWSNAYKSIEPVMRHFYGLSVKETPSQIENFVKVGTDDEPIRHYVEYSGHGQFSEKTENDAVIMGDFYQSTDKTFRATTHAGGFSLGYETVKDTKLREIKNSTTALGRAAKATPNYLFGQFLDRAFNSSYPANWDGLELCSTAHLFPDGLTTFANELATPAALSETSVQDILTQLRQMKNGDNMLSPEQPNHLIVPSALEWVAEKIKQTPNTIGTANNDKNIVRTRGWDVQVFDYLTSTTRHFMSTHNMDGLFLDYIEKPQFLTDNVIMNMSKIYISFFRALWGCPNPRGIFGVAATT